MRAYLTATTTANATTAETPLTTTTANATTTEATPSGWRS